LLKLKEPLSRYKAKEEQKKGVAQCGKKSPGNQSQAAQNRKLVDHTERTKGQKTSV